MKQVTLSALAPAVVRDDFGAASLCGSFTTDSNGNIASANETFLAWTGFSRLEVVGKRRLQDFLSPAGMVFFQTRIYPVLHLNQAFHGIALRLLTKDGTDLPVLLNGSQRRGMGNDVAVTDFMIVKAEERLRYEAALREACEQAEHSSELLRTTNSRLVESYAALHEQSQLLRLTFNAIADGVIAVDLAGNITFVNPAAARTCQSEHGSVVGMPLDQVFCPVDESTGSPLNVLTNPSEDLVDTATTTSWVLQTATSAIPLSITVARMNNEAGGTVGYLIVFRDISAAREFETQLRYHATHDTLTQLINRREFERLLAEALRAVAPSGHVLMYMDLDQFKIVNDTCGHAAGDELLRQLSHVMRKKLRKDDTLARLGGDEFGVLLHRGTLEEALAVAGRLRQTVKGFDFVWGKNVFPIGVSIGLVALLPGQMLPVDALRIADSACYVAKEKGRNRVHVAQHDDMELKRHKGEVAWVSRLHAALKEGRFVLFGQKIVSLKPDPRVSEHVEVLIRMQDIDGTLVAPMAFIPAAERYGIMPQIDRWVISTLLRHYHALHTKSGEGAVYAINLSGTTLCDDGFLPFVREALAQSGVSPCRICFEVTETAAIANLAEATHLITELKAMGCRFSLDDFGSGMSSFGYLKHLPVDFLKIDGRFVKDLLDDPVNHAMVDAINRVGQVMGLSTIAEFVENEKIVDALREIGVDFAQGYGVHKPQRLLGH